MNVQYCQRCGSTLPDQEEGICPGCGTPFGARTVAISVGAGLMLLDAFLDWRRGKGAS